MVEISERVSHLKGELEQLLECPRRALNPKELVAPEEKSGVYLICSQGSEAALYVGRSGRMLDRLRKDLLGSGKHTLKRKLAASGISSGLVMKEYLRNCRVRMVERPSEAAKWLEHFAIAVLMPEHND